MHDAVPTNFIKLLADVAKRSQKLGYKINHVASKHPQIDLAFQSLKVAVDDQTIDATMYLEDTVYHKNNYPGFKQIKTPQNPKHILHILNTLKNRYERVVELHEKILHLGLKIDDLRSRIRMLGIVDRSSQNYAENLVEQDTTTQKIPDVVKKREIAAHLNKPIIRKRGLKFLEQIKRINPDLYHRIQLRQAREAIQQTGEAKIATQTTVTRPKPMVVMSKDLEKRLSPKLTPEQKIEAALANIRLRKFIVTQSIAPVQRQRGRFKLTMGLVPRSRNLTELSSDEIKKLRDLISHHTRYPTKLEGLRVGKKETALTFVINANRG